jgi:RNA polymerase sigma factor (TIGR02999 family)
MTRHTDTDGEKRHAVARLPGMSARQPHVARRAMPYNPELRTRRPPILGDAQMGEVTLLLEAARRGQPDAIDRLFSVLYRELRSAARRQLRRLDHRRTLDTTVIVHESYLRLRHCNDVRPEDRHQFLAYAAAAMRAVIIDLARSRLASKRGGNNPAITLNTTIAESASASDTELIAVHEALEELAAIEPRLAKIVEMRYFGGLSEQEVADALGIAKRTVQRDWEKARVFLFAALQPQQP